MCIPCLCHPGQSVPENEQVSAKEAAHAGLIETPAITTTPVNNKLQNVEVCKSDKKIVIVNTILNVHKIWLLQE